MQKSYIRYTFKERETKITYCLTQYYQILGTVSKLPIRHHKASINFTSNKKPIQFVCDGKHFNKNQCVKLFKGIPYT